MEKSNVTPLVPKDNKTSEKESLVSSLSPREIEIGRASCRERV